MGTLLRLALALFVWLTLFAMPADAARAPDRIEKEIVLTGDAATSVARLFGLTSAGAISLPLFRSKVITVFDPPDPQQFNTLKFSPGPPARLSISPYWFDLQTAIPRRQQRPGYSFGSPFLPRDLDVANPWTPLMRQLQQETSQAEWHAMEINTGTGTNQKYKISRCFTSEEQLKLCVAVYGARDWDATTGKPTGYGYEVDINVQDMTAPEQVFPKNLAAAGKGDVNAQFWLCQRQTVDFYDDGLPVPLNPVQAVAWCRKAADQGFVPAQKQLGDMYEYGENVAQDYAQAMIWYRKAAQQGDAKAQWKLGQMYENGQGVAKDYAQAMIWYRKAAEQGDLVARDCLDELLRTQGHQP
jgi:TPR repeat protein